MAKIYIATVWLYNAPTETEPELFERVVVRGTADSQLQFGEELLELYGGFDAVAVPGPLSVSKYQDIKAVRSMPTRRWSRRGRTKAEVAADPRAVL